MVLKVGARSIYGPNPVAKPPAPFIAIDGEATDDGYCLLANSLEQTMVDLRPGGLHTIRCFEFLLRIPKPSIAVVFGLNYDVNNWLRDVPRKTLKELWEKNIAYWRSYRIEWIPGRWLAIKDIDGRYTKIHEVWGFFQSSFVKALEAWGIGAPSEIERMKAERGSFKAKDIKKVTRYCLHECELLVTLMDELREACREAGIIPRSWIGAGALAMALLGSQGMDDHHAYDLEIATEPVVEDVILGAYFAGRIELHRQGVYQRVKTADIRSAYPSAALMLPSLDGAKLSRRKRLVEGPGIWRVKWDLPADVLVAPFPVRNKHSIYYPASGEGWYHTVEVVTALKLGYPVEVLEGYTLRRRDLSKPFNWIPGVYRKRAQLKDEGHAAEKALKLALNSVYGKLAQGYGFNSRPRWQNYFWAGEITASTRAKILKAVAKCRNPIMIATDGVFCEALPGTVREGKALGAWELGKVPELFAAQAGVYQGLYGKCVKCGKALSKHPHPKCEDYSEETLKSRGFFASEVDYGALREGYESEGANYVHHYKSRRFMGLGVSLSRKDFGVWREWREETRAILLMPERKGLRGDGVLTPHPGPLVSDPYEPKVKLIDQRALDQQQGMDQPMKETI